MCSLLRAHGRGHQVHVTDPAGAANVCALRHLPQLSTVISIGSSAQHHSEQPMDGRARDNCTCVLQRFPVIVNHFVESPKHGKRCRFPCWRMSLIGEPDPLRRDMRWREAVAENPATGISTS